MTDAPKSNLTALRLYMEMWKDVFGYEELYEVSNAGRVRSKHRRFFVEGGTTWPPYYRETKEKLRTIEIAPNGYARLMLRKDGKYKTFSVHTLVLEAFVEAKPSRISEARHLNGKRADNRLENLCWGTKKENCQDKELHGTVIRGSKMKHSILKEEDIPIIRKAVSDGVPYRQIAGQFKICVSLITMIKNKKRWAHIQDEAA